MTTVTVRRLRVTFGSWLIWLLGLAALAAVYVPLYRRYEAEGLFRAGPLPDGVSDVLGLANLGTPTGFLGATILGPLGLLVLVSAAITYGAGAVAGDEERGYLDLTVSRGVPRFWVYVGKALASGVSVVSLGAAFTALVGWAVRAIDLPIVLTNVVATGLALTLLAILHASIALAVGAATGRGGLAKVVAGTIAIAGFVVWALETSGARYSPYTWLLGGRPLETGVPWLGVLLTLAASLAAWFLGLVAFLSRDIGRWRVDSTSRP
jgi:ABC-2 type transport system permease protein